MNIETIITLPRENFELRKTLRSLIYNLPKGYKVKETSNTYVIQLYSDSEKCHMFHLLLDVLQHIYNFRFTTQIHSDDLESLKIEG